MKEDMRVISTEEEFKIFSDPYRMKIIKTFQKSDTPLTVKGCADLMGEVPAKVHYHVKKLLSINVLALDHVEVINGINAKYYKLPHQSFTISVKDSDDGNILNHLTKIHSLVSKIIEDFKDDFMKSSAEAVEKKIKDDSEVGMLASGELHLTKEEFQELSAYLTDLSSKYRKEREGTRAYTYLGGLGKK